MASFADRLKGVLALAGAPYSQSRYFSRLLDVQAVALASVFGGEKTPREISRIARKALINRLLRRWDYFQVRRGARCREVRNPEPLLALRRSGKGALVCGFHLRPYPYLGLELCRMGFKVRVLMSERVIQEWRKRFRTATRRFGRPVELISAESPRSLLTGVRALSNGETLVAYVDGNYGSRRPGGPKRHHARFEFLSMPVKVPTGVVYLAQRAKVPLVLGVAYKEKGKGIVLELSDPIPPPEEENEDERLVLTQRIYGHLETYVRRYPEQWAGWFQPYDFWAEAGRAPEATPEEIQEARSGITTLLDSTSDRSIASADPMRLAFLPTFGVEILYEGPTRRILRLSPMAAKVVRSAFKKVSLKGLGRRFRHRREELVEELARLSLAGLVKIRSPGPDA